MSTVEQRKITQLAKASVAEDMMRAPNLADLDPGFRRKLIELALELLKPTNDTEKIPWNDFAKVIHELGDGRMSEVKQSILEVLHRDPVLGYSEPAGGGIMLKKSGRYCVQTGYQLYVKSNHLHAIIVGTGYLQHDNRAFAYVRCHQEVARMYQEKLNQCYLFESERVRKQRMRKEVRASRQTQLGAAGVNPVMGIGANADKHMLQRIAPGPGSQKVKIRSSRKDGKRVYGSAMSHLNPNEAGLVAGLQARQAFVLGAHRAELVALPEKQRNKRSLQIMNGWMDINFPNLTYPGLSEEENLRMVYDPLTALHYRQPTLVVMAVGDSASQEGVEDV
jgi:hypothetical protein